MQIKKEQGCNYNLNVYLLLLYSNNKYNIALTQYINYFKYKGSIYLCVLNILLDPNNV